MKISRSVDIGGRTIVFEVGQLARQAHGAVVVRHEGTFMLATVVAEHAPAPGRDFFPLTVEYREKMSAGGRIPGAYGKREGKTADHEILTSRLVDRSLRPLFPKGFACEVLVSVTLYGVDARSDLDSLAILAAAAAVHVSDLPLAGPVAGLRVSKKDGALTLMPSDAERDGASLEWVLSGTRDGLVMVEGGAAEVARADVVAALAEAHAALGPLLDVMDELRAEVGKPRREVVAAEAPPAELVRALDDALAPVFAEAFVAPKAARRARVARAASEATARHAAAGHDVAALVEERWRRHIRRRTAAGERIGGRGLDDIRDIASEVGTIPTNHGSAVFTRGETQALVSVTLGPPDDALQWETALGKLRDRFILHYNFPSFSVGEVKGGRGPGRREIGHGALARRALRPVLPAEEALPMTVRVVSDILESNGSSSMATVCGASLALMDAGVPIARPVAGIAMGLVAEDGEVAVLSDILGDEDHLGDMDFKVAGTRAGITALQLDNKLGSLPADLLERAIAQAEAGIIKILDEMDKTLSAPRPDLAAGAPQVASTRIPVARIASLIGQGGKTIQELQSSTHTRVEVKDDGRVRVSGKRAQDVKAALARIEALTSELELGRVYRAEVVSIKDFGCFVRIGDHEGLVHVSELAAARVDKVGDVVKLGDQVDVKVLGADDRGRLKLSRKAALK
ncbi:MAG: polyribonucleotide nucleotidyltransferase [Deltaproteobacteria bacterium]|nr:polyribonucleotide nucleotidyltransferase [Deltaproteobacteria bacterium]